MTSSEFSPTAVVSRGAMVAAGQAVIEAPADGYTVLVTSTRSHMLAPLIQSSARVGLKLDGQ